MAKVLVQLSAGMLSAVLCWLDQQSAINEKLGRRLMPVGFLRFNTELSCETLAASDH